MNPWNNKAFFDRVAQREGMFHVPNSPVDKLPDAVAAIVAKSRGLALVCRPTDCFVMLPWDCDEAAELHAAGFTPSIQYDGLFIGEQDWTWNESMQPLAPRIFDLVRHRDETGVSGTGKVAEGVLFADGQCVMRWCTSTRSTAIYETIADLIRIHGHNGATQVRWQG